jgi:hypothetical protein
MGGTWGNLCVFGFFGLWVFGSLCLWVFGSLGLWGFAGPWSSLVVPGRPWSSLVVPGPPVRGESVASSRIIHRICHIESHYTLDLSH